VGKILVAPGNAGTAAIAENLNLRPDDIESLGKTAKERGIDLVVVGPEGPLAAGIVDFFDRLGVPVFGPTGAATRIESSKVFARNLMEKYHIRHARGATFLSYSEAREYVRRQPLPVVIKADGLAAGKGVLLPETADDAAAAIQKIMVERAFGEAGSKILVEQCLDGEEVSVMAFADGLNFSTMVAARDHKRIFDGDRGPNTGGMGAYAPTRIIDAEVVDVINRTIIGPVLAGMQQDGHPFSGCLYVGLMMTEDGPRVLEFNCRFGDPETQVVLPLLRSDLVEIMMSCVDGELDLEQIEWSDEISVCVILASRGYPGKYDKGIPITGLDAVAEPDTFIFHAGTAIDDGKVVTSGGRVLGVTSVAGSYERAVAKAYEAIDKIRFKGMQYRSDIGYKAGVDRKARSRSQGRMHYVHRGRR